MSILDGFRDSFNSAVARFDTQVAALTQAEADLWEVHPGISDNAELMRQWQTEMNKVIAMQETVRAVRDTVSTVSGWWTTAKDALGITTTQSGGVLGAIGLMPAIPWASVALVVGGATAIAAVVYSVSQVVRQSRIWILQKENIDRANQGLPPIQDVAPGDQGGLFDGLGDSLKWIIGGAVVLMLVNRTK